MESPDNLRSMMHCECRNRKWNHSMAFISLSGGKIGMNETRNKNDL